MNQPRRIDAGESNDARSGRRFPAEVRPRKLTAKLKVVEALTSGFAKGWRPLGEPAILTDVITDQVGEGVDKDFAVRIGAAALPPLHRRPGDKWMRKLAESSNRHTVRPVTVFVLDDASAPRTLDVESVDTDFFTAIWRQNGHPDRRVRFPLSLVASADRELLVVGAIFYWSMGVETGANGQPQMVNQLMFRRLVSMSNEVWDEAKNKAMDWFKGDGVITQDDLEGHGQTIDNERGDSRATK